MLYRAVPVALMAVVLLTILPSTESPAHETPRSAGATAQEVLAKFDEGDPGWKVRMEALVRLARIGPEAVPALIEALQKGSPTTREFAAQALVLFADARAKAALEQAVGDATAGVRIHAILALSMFGPLPATERNQQLTASDPSHFGVRPIMAAALALKEAPHAAALRKTLADYDLALMGRARFGEPAPDFMLMDYEGKPHRLSDYRGRQVIVLRFLLYDH